MILANRLFRNLNHIVLLAILAWSAPLASAFNYTNGDVLLIFRTNNWNKDVEFDIGPVSQFLNKPDGTMITVTNWSPNLVTNVTKRWAGVKFIVAAATAVNDNPARLWLTDAELSPITPPTDMSPSAWSVLRSKIETVGARPTAYTFTNSSQAYVTNSSDASAYTAIVSENGNLDPANMGGSAPFVVEGDAGGVALFYQLRPNPTRPAAQLIGSFSLDMNGTLVFTAGPYQGRPPLVAPTVVSLSRLGSVTTVFFTTSNSLNYRLWYVNQLGPPWPWSSNSTTVAGDGRTNALTDNYSGSHRYYRVEVF